MWNKGICLKILDFGLMQTATIGSGRIFTCTLVSFWVPAASCTAINGFTNEIFHLQARVRRKCQFRSPTTAMISFSNYRSWHDVLSDCFWNGQTLAVFRCASGAFSLISITACCLTLLPLSSFTMDITSGLTRCIVSDGRWFSDGVSPHSSVRIFQTR